MPDKDKMIYLSDTANTSTGGTAEDCADDIHSSLKCILERVSKMLNLDITSEYLNEILDGL